MERKIVVTDDLIYYPVGGISSEVMVIRPKDILRASLGYAAPGVLGAVYLVLDKEGEDFLVESSSNNLTDDGGLDDLRGLLVRNGCREVSIPGGMVHLVRPGKILKDGLYLYVWAKDNWHHLFTIFSPEELDAFDSALGDLIQDRDDPGVNVVL